MEYIVGDFAKISLEDKKQVVSVIGYDPTYEEYLLSNEYIHETRGCVSVAEDKIMPIPLTPRILKKNGWDKEEKDGSVFSLSEVFMGGDENDEDNYTCFQLYYQNKKDGWVIDMRGEPLKFGVHYVHELQHLFFGLGINHKMKV